MRFQRNAERWVPAAIQPCRVVPEHATIYGSGLNADEKRRLRPIPRAQCGPAFSERRLTDFDGALLVAVFVHPSIRPRRSTLDDPAEIDADGQQAESATGLFAEPR